MSEKIFSTYFDQDCSFLWKNHPQYKGSVIFIVLLYSLLLINNQETSTWNWSDETVTIVPFNFLQLRAEQTN